MIERGPGDFEPSICESCGVEFGCGAKLAHCWCMAVTLAGNQPENIKTKYSNCLCPKCLSEYVSNAGMKITYPDGSAEIIADAVRVDTQNFHEGMFDFYDQRGNLLRQIGMDSDIKWEAVDPSK